MIRKFAFLEKTALFLFHFVIRYLTFFHLSPKKQTHLLCVLEKIKVLCYRPLQGKQKYQGPQAKSSRLFILLNFQVETHSFKFTIHVLDDQHPSSVASTNEPLVGVV